MGKDMMLFVGGSGQSLPAHASFRVGQKELTTAEKTAQLEDYRSWRSFGNPPKCTHMRQMVKRVMVVLRYVRRFREAAMDHEKRRREALLKPPGPSRKIGDLNLIAQTLGHLAWIKRLPDPETACKALAPHVVMRCIRRGTVVYREGDVPDAFHLVLSGGVDITRSESLSRPTRTLWTQAALLAGNSRWGNLFHSMGESLNNIEAEENAKRAELKQQRRDKERSGTAGSDASTSSASRAESGVKMVKVKANWAIALNGIRAGTMRKGVTVVLGELGEGEGFGDAGFGLDASADVVRPNTVVASDDTELISIDAAGFRKFLSPQVEGKLAGQVKFLRSMGLFGGVMHGTVGDRVLVRVARCMMERTYRVGEVMARQGEENDQMFMMFIVRGRARVIREVTAAKAIDALKVCRGSRAAKKAGASNNIRKRDSRILPPPPTKHTRAAQQRTEAYIRCAFWHGGPDAKLPLELDILDKGDFYIRDYTNQVTGDVLASTSLIAKEPNTVAYIINKWDFLRVVGDIPGADTCETCEARAAEYVDDARSVSEWYAGATWAAYRGELSSQLKETGHINMDVQGKASRAKRLPPKEYESELNHAAMRAVLLRAENSVIHVPSLSQDPRYASLIVSQVPESMFGAGRGGGGMGGLMSNPNIPIGSPDVSGLSPRQDGSGDGEDTPAPDRGRGGQTERRRLRSARVGVVIPSSSEQPPTSRPRGNGGSGDEAGRVPLRRIPDYGPAPTTADALAHVGSITGLRRVSRLESGREGGRRMSLLAEGSEPEPPPTSLPALTGEKGGDE